MSYGAGRLLAQGDGDNLYNLGHLVAVQRDLLPGSTNACQLFPYPPYVALIYWPLSLLDYRLSFSLFTLLMVGTLFLTLNVIKPMNEFVDKYFIAVFTLILFFYPVLRSVLGGQNTTISLLIIALTWRLVASGREYTAGLVLGALLFKPQFGLTLIGLFLLSRRWRVVIGGMVTALLLYGLGYMLQGSDWIIKWTTFALWFSDVDAQINKANAISWLGFFQGIMGVRNKAAHIIGWGMSLLTAGYLSWVWWKGGKKADLKSQLGLACSSLILMLPHVMYYDMGLLVFTCLALVGKIEKYQLLFVTILWLSGFSQTLSKLAGFSPLFFVTLLTWIVSIRVFSSSRKMTVV